MVFLHFLNNFIKKSIKLKLFFLKFYFFKIANIYYTNFFKKNNFTDISSFFWPIRYSFTEVFWVKKLWPLQKLITCFFLRKSKIFYKGRYARNRQSCRVIVFWTLSLNLIFLYGLYFFFYQFTFNFGYFWWGLLFLYFTLVWSFFLKNQFYNILNLILEFFYFFKWFFFFIPKLFWI